MDNAKIEIEIIEAVKINNEMETLLRQLYEKLLYVEYNLRYSIHSLSQLVQAIDMFLSDEKIVMVSE